MRALAATRGSAAGRDDGGNAIIEFIFVAVIMMVPLVYLIAAVAVVQRDTAAVAQAARNAGRAFATSETEVQARQRVAAAVHLALRDRGLPDDAQVRFVAAGAKCTDRRVTPRLAPGAVFTVCVTRRAHLPAVPSVLSGRGIKTVGMYVVHVDDFRPVPG